MGLFSRNKQNIDIITNAVEVNEIDPTAVARPFAFNWFKKGKADYARMIWYIILTRLFNALKNVSWRTTKIHYTAMDVLNFIEMNAEILIYHYLKNGFCCVIVEKSGNIRLPQVNELRFDSKHRVVNRNAIVVYSDPYTIEYTTHYLLSLPYLNSINDNMNNSNFIGNQSGLFGVLSGKNMPISPAAREEVEEKLKKRYGYDDDQYNFIISNSEIDFTPIQIPVDKLKLDEKCVSDFKWLCNLYGINPDFFLGGSTFSNQADATRNFYRNAVIPLAEVLLRLGRSIFIYINTDLEPSTILTYDLSNVPEFDTTLSSKCEEKRAYLDYLLALRDAGVDIEADIRKLYESSRDMLGNV